MVMGNLFGDDVEGEVMALRPMTCPFSLPSIILISTAIETFP